MTQAMQTKGIRHLFWSATGEILPRWRDAFSNAQSVGEGESAVSSKSKQPVMAWIRLTPERPVDEQVAEARKRLGPVPIIVLSDTPSDQEALAAFSATARAYCNSHATPEVLLQVASVVEQGGLWIGESLMQRLVQATAGISQPSSQSAQAAAPWEAKLTEREREVAKVVASGTSNKEVARQLGITERTVKAHLTTIMDKLGVRDRLQLALAVHQK
jgi:DNA-binding NarL/FixJ family response regulator